jgi:hypothetical protein
MKALNFTHVDQLLDILQKTDIEQHFFARTWRNRRREMIVRLHMSGTKNSRRFLHVYLWWMMLFGPYYPISDLLLQGQVWKHLRCLCGMGIIDTRGHRTGDRDHICINPNHYQLEPTVDVAGILLAEFQSFIQDVHASDRWASSAAVQQFANTLEERLSAGASVGSLIEFIRKDCKFAENM